MQLILELSNNIFICRKDENIKNKIYFKNKDLKMADEIYLPENFDKNEKYSVIVVTHPGGGVKEQVAGTYAYKLAEQGFVSLAFDASYQGEGEGEPKYLEN